MKLNKLVLAVAVATGMSFTVAHAAIIDIDVGVLNTTVKQNSTDITALQAKDAQLRKDIDTTYALANTKYTEAAGKALEGQVANKVDKSVFTADQARQDKATADLNSKVDGYAAQGAAAYNELKGADKATNDRITTLQGQGVAAYNELKGSISSGSAAQAERDAGQDEHINAVQAAAQAANEKADAGAIRADNIEKQAANLDGRVGQTEVRLDNAEGAIRDVQGAAQTANDRVGAAEVRLDGVEQKNAQQDDHINAVQEVAAAADSRSQNNAVRLDTVEGGLRDTNKQLEVTDARSINNATRLDSAEGAIRETNTQVAANDKAINTRVDGVQKVQAAHTATLANHETRITNTETQVASNTSEIKKTQTVVNKHTDQLANHETRITNTEANVSNLTSDYYQFQDTYNYNNQVINQNMQAYSAQAVQQSKAYTDQQVGQLRNDWRQGRSDDQKEYRSGIASVAAMANIPVVPGQRLTVGAGIGQFKDRTALAVGVGANIAPNVAAKASVGFSNDSDAVVGAGIGFGF